MPFFKSKRAARYWDLRSKHLSPVEAREFSRLRRKYPALKVMIKRRSAQWAGFQKRVDREGWSKTKADREWRGYLERWYRSRGWMVTKNVHGKEYKKPHPSPWKWYDTIFQKLPPWEKWDTPRQHRRKTKEPDIKLDKVMKARWVAQLNKSIREARGDPERQVQLREQKRRLLR